MFIAPLDLTKLPHRWLGMWAEAMLSGLVFLGVVGFMRWDVLVAVHQDRTFADWEKGLAILTGALGIGMVLTPVSAVVALGVGVFGSICGGLISNRTAELGSRNMLWRRIALRILPDSIIRLEEPAPGLEEVTKQMEAAVKQLPSDFSAQETLVRLVTPAASYLYRDELDVQWRDLYRVLNAYLYRRPEEVALTMGLTLQVTLAGSLAMLVCRAWLPLVGVLWLGGVVSSMIFVFLIGVGEGQAHGGDAAQAAVLLSKLRGERTIEGNPD